MNGKFRSEYAVYKHLQSLGPLGTIIFEFSFYFSIIQKGEAECGELIEAHKACMRKLGFNIWWFCFSVNLLLFICVLSVV